MIEATAILILVTYYLRIWCVCSSRFFSEDGYIGPVVWIVTYTMMAWAFMAIVDPWGRA